MAAERTVCLIHLAQPVDGIHVTTMFYYLCAARRVETRRRNNLRPKRGSACLSHVACRTKGAATPRHAMPFTVESLHHRPGAQSKTHLRGSLTIASALRWTGRV